MYICVRVLSHFMLVAKQQQLRKRRGAHKHFELLSVLTGFRRKLNRIFTFPLKYRHRCRHRRRRQSLLKFGSVLRPPMVEWKRKHSPAHAGAHIHMQVRTHTYAEHVSVESAMPWQTVR